MLLWGVSSAPKCFLWTAGDDLILRGADLVSAGLLGGFTPLLTAP